MCEDGVLKRWRSAVLHQHLLVGWTLLPVLQWWEFPPVLTSLAAAASAFPVEHNLKPLRPSSIRTVCHGLASRLCERGDPHHSSVCWGPCKTSPLLSIPRYGNGSITRIAGSLTASSWQTVLVCGAQARRFTWQQRSQVSKQASSLWTVSFRKRGLSPSDLVINCKQIWAVLFWRGFVLLLVLPWKILRISLSLFTIHFFPFPNFLMWVGW